MLLASSASCSAQRAAVSGVVRDVSGVAQLGVLVQVMALDSAVVGRAFTDLRGHYLVSNLDAGNYQVQASAALFVPVLKSQLQVRAGARTVLNLTMSTIFDTTSWLPAERRKADEPADDWTWTLRSAANRPILRVLPEDGENGQLIMVSSSATESHAPSVRGRATVTSGDGGFGNGGIHSVFTMDTAEQDGSGVILRADTGAGRTQFGVGPSTELSAGYERQTGFATTVRAVTSFQSHPEFVSAGSATGLQTMELATAQRTKLGDLISLEAGGASFAVHTQGYSLAARPFFRVMVEPAAGWTFAYRMATSRDLQSFAGLNAIQPEVPVAVVTPQGLRTEQGRHQEVAVARKFGRGQVQAAAYKDALTRVALEGTGALSAADLASLGNNRGGIADSLTGTFRLLAPGLNAQGLNLMLSQPLGDTLWAIAEYSTGTALNANTACDAPTRSLPAVLSGMHQRKAQSATFAVKGTLPGTGTKLRAVYRWQPRDLLTPVDIYREFADQAFASFHVRQPVRWEGVLPSGLEGSIDVTNLLAQGYQPFLSADGRTLYLAQTPRTLQAGLSINF